MHLSKKQRTWKSSRVDTEVCKGNRDPGLTKKLRARMYVRETVRGNESGYVLWDLPGCGQWWIVCFFLARLGSGSHCQGRKCERRC